MSNAVTYLSRTVLFIIKVVIIIAVIGAFLYYVFSFATEATTAYMVTKEGLEMREDVVIKDESPSDLNKLFSESFLDKDELLNSTVYRDYTIRDYYQDIELKWVWVDMFKNSATVKVNEKVWYINGDKKLEEGEKEEEAAPPPVWASAQYDVSLRKVNGTWKITEMKKLEDIILPTPSPTPKPSPTLTPSPTATPEESDESDESAEAAE